jgi:antitoxin VapB
MDLELRINSDETLRAVSELATLKGESLETAVLIAVQERLRREREKKEKVDRIMAVAREIRAHMREPVSSDHSWLYDDETGLPK